MLYRIILQLSVNIVVTNSRETHAAKVADDSSGGEGVGATNRTHDVKEKRKATVSAMVASM
jgi:hypothetical protein